MVWYSLLALDLEANWCLIAAKELAKNGTRKNIRPLSLRDFQSIFGVHPNTVTRLHYIYLYDCDSSLFQPKYLLWMLSFLKNYETEPNSSLKFLKSNPRDFRDMVWKMIYYLSEEMEEVFSSTYFLKYTIIYV